MHRRLRRLPEEGRKKAKGRQTATKAPDESTYLGKIWGAARKEF